MRRNFTQLFMSIALMAGFAVVSHAQCDEPIPAPEGAIYHEQFDGGLGDWQSLDVNFDPTTIGFVWSETGDISQGAFLGNGPTNIASPSVCNGAAVMNSDFLDNNGDQTMQGMGPCPAPCQGYLRSPAIDLSMATGALELHFFQALRQFQSEFSIYISLDEGISNVDTIIINDVIATNAGNGTGEMLVLPLCGISGESSVTFTFSYNANYYFWAIDDFSIIPADADAVDMQVNSNFYAKMPHYITPSNFTTEVALLADIGNNSVNASPESDLTVRVTDDAGATLFSATQGYPSIPSECEATAAEIAAIAENMQFDEQYVMPMAPGDYMIDYTIEAEGDEVAENDIRSAPFTISDREFRNLPSQEEFGSEYLSGVRFGTTAFFSWGGYFYFPHNDANQAIEEVTLGIIANEEPSVGIVTVAVYQWIDLQLEGEDGFREPGADEIVLLGFTEYFVEPQSALYQEIKVTPTEDGSKGGDLITPEAGSEILVIAHANPFNGDLNYFGSAVAGNGFEEYSFGATTLAHEQASLKGGFTSFVSVDGASDEDKHERGYINVDLIADPWTFDVNMLLTPPVSTEEINEELAVEVYPTLASDFINLDIALEATSPEVSVEFLNATGLLMRQFEFSNVRKDVLTMDISDLNSGMYIVNIRTEEGMISKKVTIMH